MPYGFFRGQRRLTQDGSIRFLKKIPQFWGDLKNNFETVFGGVSGNPPAHRSKVNAVMNTTINGSCSIDIQYQET